MRIFAATVSLAALATLSACGDAPEEDSTDLEVATTESEEAAMDAAREAGDFLDLQLGAKIVGPQGPEVEGALSNAEGNFADIRSYVACPAGMDPCNPKTAPEGTVYTFVHTVFPGEDNQDDSGSGQANNSSDIERATAFRMTAPAHGFTGSAGYAKASVLAAIGDKATVVVTCVDGALVWTVDAGEGGNQWEQAEPVTFYWQSTLPPAGPSDKYAIEANYTTATGPGPYPAATDGVSNACLPEADESA
ncbi:hypothetical protein N8940_01280 [Sphingomonadaceae bacterium]|nr:hypothetical protein [Sphingomonadaceae bacterium]